MGHSVTLSTADGPLSAWRADPSGPVRGALVVVQEIFGLNAHIRGVVDRFAEAGFAAIAPALFDPLEPGLELPYDADGVARGLALVDALGFERPLAAVAAAAAVVEAASPSGRVGVVGYCWGGSVAFLANCRLGLPAVSYYGGRTVPLLGRERPRAPLLLHFGEHDPLIPAEHVALHREHLPGAEFAVWPAGHGFNCEMRADYHAPSAAAALERTLAFFGQHLR
ncbi:MAG: dienelactone hydrolase family protein [Xanthomonadaceae bacterium]|jgi:carboxymethylenebutenolidase|nr:dienelactone hydrolase family protein [Xanthomonadaceae bacterium]